MGHRAIGITSNVNSDFGDGICDVIVDYGIGIETVGYVTLDMVGLVLYFIMQSKNTRDFSHEMN
mgnify:FL=1